MATSARIDGRRALLLVALWAAGIALWRFPFMLPLKLLVVTMHESGHALATLFMGGSVDQITLQSNEGGACMSRLPASTVAQIVVYSAGYVGSAIAGGLLIVATLRWKWKRPVLAMCSLWLGLMTVLYARDVFTLGFCAAMAAVLGLAAWKLPEGAVEAINLFLAAFSSLYAVSDLRDDLWNSATRAQSDAALLANLTYVPSIVWAALWTVLSIALLGALAIWGLRAESRPRISLSPALR